MALLDAISVTGSTFGRQWEGCSVPAPAIGPRSRSAGIAALIASMMTPAAPSAPGPDAPAGAGSRTGRLNRSAVVSSDLTR
ncbi:MULTISPECIES: hypothetical protein [unclassified Methanoculleus]|uniref:hypothetical protein n=1 Tax=unclassified Methanoculleus TaxID=2619537 RepID=UPI0025EBF74F|nr:MULTISPECIES: hypothetical protein [unclassified Methanoculleus]